MPVNNTSSEDYRWMERALTLAEQSVGVSSPNPAVGCVLIKNGTLIGEGFHQYALKDHAEIAALKAATDSPRGATAYVTLEPCSHTGRTGPCSTALVEAGVQRVVVATGDPNPQVRGQGFERLRNAGIEVLTGIKQDEARRLNEGFARWIQTGRPFVTLKAAITLDGRIAPASTQRSARETWWITGAESRAEVQKMRHTNDAILTGVDTVLADDPLLTDRSGLPRRRPLKRIVLDSQLRTPPASKLLQNSANPATIFTTCKDRARIQMLEPFGAEVITMPSAEGRVSLDEVFAYLGKNQILSVLVEAGTRLNTALLAGGFVDRMRLFVAPILLGGDAVPVFEALPEAMRFPAIETIPYGNDLAWNALLRDPWGETIN